MKVMFRRREDQALFCLLVSEAGYDPKLKELWFQGYGSRNFSEVIIHNIDLKTAEKILWMFFNQQSLDLTHMYPAEIIPGSSE